jgi:SAM-dependent methyltransferase
VDTTAEMLELARDDQIRAGVTNAEFLGGRIEAVPLPDRSADVVVSNCVINLSADKDAVFAEAHPVAAPRRALAVADVVVDGEPDAELIANDAAWAACIAGPAIRGGHDPGRQHALVDDREDPVELFARRRVPHLVDLHQHVVHVCCGALREVPHQLKGDGGIVQTVAVDLQAHRQVAAGAAKPRSATRSRRPRQGSYRDDETGLILVGQGRRPAPLSR